MSAQKYMWVIGIELWICPRSDLTPFGPMCDREKRSDSDAGEDDLQGNEDRNRSHTQNSVYAANIYRSHTLALPHNSMLHCWLS